MSTGEIAGIFLFYIVIFLLGIFLWILPGIIASRRNHAYKNIIWILALVGIGNGITWLIAIIWALWPQEKSWVDPLIGNVTGTGTRNMGDTIGAVVAGVSQGGKDEITLRNELMQTKDLLDQGLINEEEYKRRREKILNL